MSEKRFEKLAARDRARRAERAAAEFAKEPERATLQGPLLWIVGITGIALAVIVVLLIYAMATGGEVSLRDRLHDAIYSGLGMDAASRNPDILALAPAPVGWRREEFTGVRDGRIVRGVVELAILDVAADPTRREEIIAGLVERFEDGGLDSLTDAEQEVLGGPAAVNAARSLRQFGGDMAVAVYTNGREIFVLQLIRSGGGGRAEAFSLTDFQRSRVLVGGMEFDDGTQNAGGDVNPMSGIGGLVILSRELNEDVHLTVHGLGNLSGAEVLIGASDFGVFIEEEAGEEAGE